MSTGVSKPCRTQVTSVLGREDSARALSRCRPGVSTKARALMGGVGMEGARGRVEERRIKSNIVTGRSLYRFLSLTLK